MTKAKIDLTKRLHTIKYRRLKTVSIALSVPFALAVSSLILYSLLPWSFQLFLRWVLRQGDLHQIPEKLHAELNEMCYHIADEQGIVKGRHYLQNIEIADSLGTFRCTLVNGGQEWLIQDHKSFNSPDEAIMGTELAVTIASLLGTDYSYDIEARIPNLQNNDYLDSKDLLPPRKKPQSPPASSSKNIR